MRALPPSHARGLDVTSDLGAELRGAREPKLIAEALHECRLDLVAVDVAFPIEQVCLEGPVAATESRSHAEARRGRDLLLAHTHRHRVDAVARQKAFAWDGEIYRREAELPPALRAVHDRASNAVWTAEKARRALHIAREESVADPRRAHHFPTLLHRCRDDHGEAVLRTGRRERAHVSAAVVPELEVLAHEDLAHLALRGQPPDELVGRERGELLCEVEDHDVARAGPAEQSRALFHVRQSGRRRSGRERAA